MFMGVRRMWAAFFVFAHGLKSVAVSPEGNSIGSYMAACSGNSACVGALPPPVLLTVTLQLAKRPPRPRCGNCSSSCPASATDRSECYGRSRTAGSVMD